MSMVRCDYCNNIFDSDNDPDCFIEVIVYSLGVGEHYEDRIKCEPCRDKDEA